MTKSALSLAVAGTFLLLAVLVGAPLGLARASAVAAPRADRLPATAPAATVAPATASASTAPAATAQRAVVVAVPGLRWDDVSAGTTPTLWSLAGSAATGVLSVRSARSVTCPGDGFATLSAGNRARDPESGPTHGVCPQIADHIAASELAAWMSRVRADNKGLEFDAEVGAQGASVHGSRACTAATGAGGGLAAADLGGHVDVLTRDPGHALASRCALVVVQGPSVTDPDRAAAARAADALVRAVTAMSDAGTLVIVAGVSETGDDPPHLHVVMAKGPGFGPGDLVSPTTRRTPYVQLIDVAPTVLRALGIDAPRSMAGRPFRAAKDASASAPADVVHNLVDLDSAAQAQRRLVPPFFLVLVLAQALLYALAWFALRHLPADARRRRVLRITEVAAVTGAAALPATYLANALPWWRAGHGVLTLLAAIAACTAVITAVAFAGPWRRVLLGPVTAVTAITSLVLVADLVTGARLQMSSLAGYSPLVAGRFAGVGNVAFAVLATASLLTVAALTSGLPRRPAVAAVAVVGGVVIAVDGAPTWGDDFGGVIALVCGFSLLGLLVARARVTWRRVLVIGLGSVAMVATFALLDYARPADDQTHLGRFVGQLLHGGAGTIIRRKAAANLHLLAHSVLTLLVPLAVALLAGVLLRPSGGLRRAFAAVPALRHGLVAVLAMGVVGALVNDSGVAIPALAMTVAIPVAIAVSARVAREGGDDAPEAA